MIRIRLLYTLGTLLCLVAVCAGVFVWLIAVPKISALAPDYDENRSIAGMWRDCEAGLRLGMWGHDDAFLVGRFGGKAWAEPLAESVISGEGVGCAGGHRDSSLEYLTNHSAPDEEKLAEFWSEWWRKHKDESQAEWIKQGFAVRGIVVALPTSEANWPDLLRVLGAELAGPTQARESKNLQPENIRYNAYRWLRDSGFDPVRFMIDHDEARRDPEITRGLLEYREKEIYLRTALAGRLDFAPDHDWGWAKSLGKPPILELRNQVIAAFVLLAVFSLGIGLITHSRRMKKRNTSPTTVTNEPTPPLQ